MSLTLKEKQAVTKQLALEYKRATKKEKGRILDSVIQLTKYNHSYAARVLRQRARYVVIGRGVVKGVKVTLVEDERNSGRGQVLFFDVAASADAPRRMLLATTES